MRKLHHNGKMKAYITRSYALLLLSFRIVLEPELFTTFLHFRSLVSLTFRTMFATLITAALAATTVFASPIISNSNVVHEKRDVLPPGWNKRSELSRRALLPMKIALAQNNLEKGGDWLHEVSDPDSERYGKHWTAKDIAEAFAPSDDTISAVKAWLASHNIGEDRIKHGQSMGFLQFDASVDEAENLLNTKYNVYEHSESKQPHVACEEYSIPAHLSEHVDFITPTVHFDSIVKRHDKRQALDKRAITPGVEKSLGLPGSPSLPKQGATMDGADIQKRLRYCNTQVTPDCLRALYDFQHGHLALKKNAYGIVEYTPQAYVPSDLDKFFRQFAQKAVGERPVLDSIDGGVVQQTNMSFGYNGESDLDLEYAMSLVYPQNVVLYQVGDLVEGASFNNFLDAIDGSYCTFRGGDSKQQDAVYPDPLPGGYKGPENCGGFAATKVISTSYSYNEHDLTPFYERRQCAEYLKLGLMGVSVLYSSGDYGVAGNGGQCIAADGTYNNGKSGRFNPSFPGTCPWITSVGATQVKPHISLPNAIASGTEPEKACETVIYSGGGFSNVFPLPGYQSKAVKSFFANYPPPYTSAQYNNSQATRGFPDISANGANYVVAVDGNFSLVYGTSASSPTLGSILTLINEERFAKGLSSIGFVNPVAYKNPGVFNDITAGGNQGCGTAGFSAVPGWVSTRTILRAERVAD
jgi:tripeptidyl-peptidase-1